MLWRNGRSVVDRIVFPIIIIGSTNDLDRKKEISGQNLFLTFSNSKCTKTMQITQQGSVTAETKQDKQGEAIKEGGRSNRRDGKG